MTCVNIVDHRRKHTQMVDAVVEVVLTPGVGSETDQIHPVKILNNTTIEKVMQFAQRVKYPVVVVLYNINTL